MKKRIIVLDTTLRDGEQVPGAKLNLLEKLEIAKQLKKLNIDIIEAGFPASSAGDFNSVKTIAKEIGNNGPMITALARANKKDIEAVYNSVKLAERPLIHIVLGTSNQHVEKKFNRSQEEILEMGVEAVKFAKSLLPEVQYSTEDASRSDFEYLWKTIAAVVKAGATMINVPDTVGFATPDVFGALIAKINYRLKNLNDKVLLSVHCHNDLGLATANTLAAIKNGADKVECTINGIGERAGNAALEEIIMALKIHEDHYKAYSDIKTKEIAKTSKLVSSLMGLEVQVNKAITGENAFAHSSGIHQDGLLKAREVYEIIDPQDVGIENMELILTARSGRHAVKNALAKIGYNFDQDEFESFFAKYLALADLKKEIYQHDLYYLVESHYKDLHGGDATSKSFQLFELVNFQVISNEAMPTATIMLKQGEKIYRSSAVGDGPIDALYSAIKEIVNIDVQLIGYKIQSVSRGKGALGRVSLQLEYNGVTYTARGTDTDTIKASALAFLNGVNSILVECHQGQAS